MNNMEEKYINLMKRIQTGNKPVVFVNGCTHGQEKVGRLVVNELEKLIIKNGTLVTNIANEKAFKKSVPFIESDLNRVFPGSSNGTYEERLAYHINPIVCVSDIVIDIHSTETMEVGSDSAVIVTKLDKQTLSYINIIKPPRVLVMRYTNNNALISSARIGLGFEYGRDKDELTFGTVLRDIKKILISLNIIEKDPTIQDNWNTPETDFFEVEGTIEKKDGYELKRGIKNFKLMKKGEIIASMGDKTIIVDDDFYPILFGSNRYKTIFGFVGKKIENLEMYVNN